MVHWGVESAMTASHNFDDIRLTAYAGAAG